MPSETTNYIDYKGIWPNNLQYPLTSYLVQLPSYETGKILLEEGKLRERRMPFLEGKTIQHEGQKTIKYFVGERSFKNITNHELVVVSALHSLGHLTGLPPEQRRLLEISGYAHDATKPIQIILDSYRSLYNLSTGEPYPFYSQEEMEIAQNIIATWLEGYELATEEVIKHTQKLPTTEYLDMFNNQVNIPILEGILKKTTVTDSECVKILTLAGSDTWAAVPNLLVTASELGDRYLPDLSQELKKLNILSAPLKSRIPHVKEMTDLNTDNDKFMALMLCYCDAIVAHDKLRSIDGRINELKSRSNYTELDVWAGEMFGYPDILEIYSTLNHGIELLLLQKIGYEREFLPEVILENLKTLVTSNAKASE